MSQTVYIINFNEYNISKLQPWLGTENYGQSLTEAGKRTHPVCTRCTFVCFWYASNPTKSNAGISAVQATMAPHCLMTFKIVFRIEPYYTIWARSREHRHRANWSLHKIPLSCVSHANSMENALFFDPHFPCHAAKHPLFFRWTRAVSRHPPNGIAQWATKRASSRRYSWSLEIKAIMEFIVGQVVHPSRDCRFRLRK